MSENVELAHRTYDAFNRRDLEVFLECMHPEVEFTTSFMQMEGAPEIRGRSGIREWWRGLFAVFPDFHAEALEVREGDGSGIVAVRMRGHGADSGAPFEVALWQAVKARDGKVIW
jgi:ketosteroid isomerase-like protein